MREIQDRSKPHCFELFATGGADIIKACKTDSEGKVSTFNCTESSLMKLMNPIQSTGGRRQAHGLPHVGRNGGGSTGMDQAPDTVHQPQSVLRYSGTKEEEGAQQELVLDRR